MTRGGPRSAGPCAAAGAGGWRSCHWQDQGRGLRLASGKIALQGHASDWLPGSCSTLQDAARRPSRPAQQGCRQHPADLAQVHLATGKMTPGRADLPLARSPKAGPTCHWQDDAGRSPAGCSLASGKMPSTDAAQERSCHWQDDHTSCPDRITFVRCNGGEFCSYWAAADGAQKRPQEMPASCR